MIPEGEVGCKICEKSIYRVFVEHIQEHLEEGSSVHEIRIARQCLHYKGFRCDNKQCLNEICPLHRKHGEEEKGA